MVLTRINNNVSAINATRNLNATSLRLSKSLERLSSGLRINRASDDAAGLSISEQQRSQIRGLRRAVANAQDAISLVNTAEGALNETTNRLQRIRELAVQAANSGGQDADAIQAAQDEIESSIREITRIADSTQFSTRILLNGDNNSTANVREGTPSRGVSVSRTTVASQIPNGTSFLRITQTQVGTEFITVGSDGVGNFALASGVDAITENTFATGAYEISVSNVQQAQAQRVESAAFSTAGSALAAGDNVVGTRFGAVDLASGDVIRFTVLDNDGAPVTTTVNVTSATNFSGLLSTINGLIGAQLTASLFNSTTSGINLRIDSLVTGESQLRLQIEVDVGGLDGVADAADEGSIAVLGQYNSAVLTIADGSAVVARAGDTVTLHGRAPNTPTADDFQRQVTLRFTAGAAFIREGVELLNVTENRYEGVLNNGRGVEFVAGQREVLFRTGTGAGFSSGDSLLLDFGTTVDLGGVGVGQQGTVIISGENRGLSFQIGANQGQSLLISLGDLRASALGFAEGLNINGSAFAGTVDTIDVRTIDGANNAMTIVDRALAQVSRQRSFLGATTNRLEATISNLGVAVENLTAAESRIRDADIAFETTEFTRNQILLQAGTSILAQANLAPQAVLQLLS